MIDNWRDFIDQEKSEDYFKRLEELIHRESGNIAPPTADIFAALKCTPLTATRVVIVGQDPYPRRGDATGLAFSVRPGYLPPTLKVILRELMVSTGVTRYDGNLSDWSHQGVLLLNRILTTQVEKTCAHEGLGWEEFTGRILRHLSRTRSGLVFALWGSIAQTAIQMIEPDRGHLVLSAVHPAAESHKPGSKFYGCNHFNLINDHLLSQGLDPIRWG